MKDKILTESVGFDWDDGNLHKNAKKHDVLWQECEEVFFNEPLLFFEDERHSTSERRMFVLGKTDAEKKIFIAFTMRNQRIRVISARDMNKKERIIYDTEAKKNTAF